MHTTFLIVCLGLETLGLVGASPMTHQYGVSPSRGNKTAENIEKSHELHHLQAIIRHFLHSANNHS